MRLALLLVAFTLALPGLCGAQTFYFGHDLSYTNQMEECGAVFKENGEPKDVYHIFADHGTNLVRARLWVDPSWQNDIPQPEGVKDQYNDLADVKETFRRAREAGMQLMLGFHYSDFWADPGRQVIPARWAHVADDLDILKDSVYQYTTNVLTELDDSGLMPDVVKIGNETNSGMLIYTTMDDEYDGVDPAPNAWDWSRQAELFNAAIQAVRDAGAASSIDPEIALHLAGLGNLDGRFERFLSFGVTDFDIMGFSYYYAWHDASIEQLGATIEALVDRFPDYEVMVAETGYPWTTGNNDGLGNIITTPDPEYLPVSPATQLEYMVDYTREVMHSGGSGVVFWEPTWVSTDCRTPWGRGSSQEHVAFFDWDNTNFMENGGGRWPEQRFYDDLDGHKVTFRLDLSDHNAGGGAYITGSFTGEPWQILPMAEAGDGVYRYFTYLPEGASGTFYFLTADDWDDREPVPDECADGDGNRNYAVPGSDVTYAAAWGECASSTGGTVEVTFAVDMTGQDVSRGVYVTGAFTGGDWEIIPMTGQGDDIYTYSTDLPNGSEGAYYFLNDDQWEARETVPAECADWWDVDRGYVAAGNDTTFAVRWGTCETFELPTTTDDADASPTGIRLHPAYPNPSSQTTTIAYELPAPAHVTLQLFDVLGHHLATLVGRQQPGGTYEVSFDASHFAAGIYFYRLQTASFSRTRTLTLAR